MPATPADFLVLPYDESLTLAGIEYARKSLHYTYNRMALGVMPRLRNIVAGVAVELAFTRHLAREEIPYDRLGSTHFTRKDLYDLRLAGRKIDLKTAFINNRRKISDLRQDPAWLLDAAALVPVDQLESDTMGERDAYLFGYLAGLETKDAPALGKAIEAGQPIYLLHSFNDQEWTRSRHWKSLGPLVLKSNAGQPVEVEMGGQARDFNPIVERMTLHPRLRRIADEDFYSVLYLHTAALPDGAIGLHSPVLKDTRLIAPHDWGNIWVYGLRIYIAGWLTKSEFRRKSKRLRPGSVVKQYHRTSADNWGVEVKELRPVGELLEAAKNGASVR